MSEPISKEHQDRPDRQKHQDRQDHQKHQDRQDRLWTIPFVMVILLNLFNGCAAQMSYPLVAKFTLSLGGDLKTASTAAGLMSLSSLFVCPFAGLLSDRFPRKRILQISFIAYAICLFLHLLAKTVPVLMALRLLTGIFFSVNSVTAVAFSTGFIPKKHMGEGLGYASLANVLAQAIGPGIGLALSEQFGFGASFLLAGLCAGASLVMISLFPRQNAGVELQGAAANAQGAAANAQNAEAAQQAPAPKQRIQLRNLFAPELTAFMLVTVLFSWGNSLLSTYLAIIGDERNITGIALFFTVYSIAMVVLRPLSGKLFDRKGVYVMMIPALIFAAAGMWTIGSAMSLTVILVAAVILAVGQGAGIPSMQAHSINRLGQERAGVAVSTIQIGQNLGNAVGPMLGGVLVVPLGYKGLFSGFSLALLIGGALLTVLQWMAEKKRSR